ncbi:MAG: DUF805 domain-containing protein [Hyphomicrobiaceae bacterium]
MYALFSFRGRLNRAPYWGYSLLMLAVLFVPIFAFLFSAALRLEGQSQSEIEAQLLQTYFWPLMAVSALSIWPSLALAGKRLQDHGKSGQLAIPLMAPGLAYNVASFAMPNSTLTLVLGSIVFAVTLFSFVYLGCMRGTVGPNQYGEDRVMPKSDLVPGSAQGA